MSSEYESDQSDGSEMNNANQELATSVGLWNPEFFESAQNLDSDDNSDLEGWNEEHGMRESQVMQAHWAALEDMQEDTDDDYHDFEIDIDDEYEDNLEDEDDEDAAEDDEEDEDYIPEDEQEDEFYGETDNDEEIDEDDSTLELAYHAILRIMTRQQHPIVHRTNTPLKRQLANAQLREHDERQKQKSDGLLSNSGWFGPPEGVYGQRNIFGYRENGRRREISSIVGGIRERELSSTYRNSHKHLGRHFVPKQHAKQLKQYEAEVYSGQYSEDGTLFYTCTKDFRVHIYDARDTEKLKEIKTIHALSGQWTLTDANLSRDNQWIAYSSLTPLVSLSSTDGYHDRNIALNFNESRLGISRIWSIRFSGSGNELVAGSSAQSEEDRSILLYDIERQKVIDSAGGHLDDVNAVCFADEGSNILISGSDDMSIRVWDRRTLHGEMATGVLVGHTEGVTYVSPKGDGRYLVSNGKDQCAKVWDIRTMVSPKVAEDTRLEPEYDYRNNFYPGVPRLHPEDCSVMTYRGHKVLRTLIRCHFSPPSATNHRYVYTGSSDGRAHIYNLDGTVNQILDSNKIIGGNAHQQQRPLGWGFGYDRTPCTRDVSWHPYLPNIIASSWINDYGYLLKHDILE